MVTIYPETPECKQDLRKFLEKQEEILTHGNK